MHSFAYCPRRYFFELYLPQPLGLRKRFRLFLGRLFHVVKGLLGRTKGYLVEKRVEAVVGGVRILGRSDAVRLNGDTVEVVERKSGRAPRGGAWVSDVLQAALYALSFLRNGSAREARVAIEYRNGAYFYKLDSDLAALAFQVIDDIVLVKYHGVVPHPRRSPRRCASCPYREVCEELDRALEAPGEVYEPGSWLEGMSLIPPVAPEVLGAGEGARQTGHEDGS
ncbi:CRISPR-associated protein Cas4 [Stetteria hydrogenophila]